MHIWILGPCCMESAESYIEEGKILSEIMGRRAWYYKASFDKANRTSINSKRGMGLKEGIKAFQQIKKEIPEIKLLTDAHETNQVEQLVGIVDAIQIPAFLCRQTDLIVTCAKYFNVVNVKKGQWMAPEETKYIAEKIKDTNNNCQTFITERGTSMGYGTVVVDFANIPILKQYFDCVILDCTHSTQRSTSDANVTGGNRKLAEQYMLAAPAFNYDGIFAEVHPDPPNAFSDKDCQIPLDQIESLIAKSSNLELFHNCPHQAKSSKPNTKENTLKITYGGFENKSPAIQNLIKKMSQHPESFEGQSKCAICGKPVDIQDFKDELSKKEWSISHMCQDCQDGVFDA